MQKKFTLTETGTTDIIVLNGDEHITFGALGDEADYTLTAQVKLTDNGIWFDAQVIVDNATEDNLYSSVSGARALRFNLTALGTATSINVEVTGRQL